MKIEIENETIEYMIRKYGKKGADQLNYEEFETIVNSS